MLIGVLALQGSVVEHCRVIESCGDKYQLVRNLEDLNSLDGLIIPGGESTTLSRLLKIKQMDEEIIAHSKRGLKIWGTCAGLILLSNKLSCNSFKPLGLIDITVSRNSYGSQVDSFETEVELEEKKSLVRFIRAPRIIDIGDNIEIISILNSEVVAVKSKSVMVTTFHPEVTNNSDFYNYFKSFILSN